MSLRRVVSPFEQRPSRRRRRFEPPGYQNNPIPPLDQDEANPRTATPISLSLAQWSLESPGLMGTRTSSQRASRQPGSSLPTGLQTMTREKTLMIPLDSIISAEKLTAEQNGTSTDNLVDFGSLSDDDDDLIPNALPTLVNRISVRGRAALTALQERSRLVRRRRRMTPPSASAPPALLLYQSENTQSLPPSQKGPPVLPQPNSARYLPLVVAQGQSTMATPSVKTTKYTIASSHKESVDMKAKNPFHAEWIPNEMPVELFETITQYLSRDDIKAMRLVNREFERGVSRALFDTVVVPFNTELYDMIEQDRTVKRDFKGKGRADDSHGAFVDNLIPGTLQWKNAMEDKEDKVYKGYGLRVFEGFGSHIKRFGMSFEVKEDALRNPPEKTALHQLDSYFGSYDWPSNEYTRFEKLAGLERTADETSQMKLAFSHLTKVRHLALCIDSGLGWMPGPDKSIQTQLLQRSPAVFGGCSHGVVDSHRQDRDRLWSFLETAYREAGRIDELKHGRLHRTNLRSSLQTLQGSFDNPYLNKTSWATVDATVVEEEADPFAIDGDLSSGVLFVRPNNPELLETGPSCPASTPQPASSATMAPLNNHVVVAETAQSLQPQSSKESVLASLSRPGDQSFSPAHLDTHQKEWLLEAEWAQRAFLMSYMLAVVDNKTVFSSITALNLARISSHLVPVFYRHDFWEGLPNLSDVALGVIPDWRTVERDEAGFVEIMEVEPSKALEGAYKLLGEYIGPRRAFKKVKFGWAAGGEHAEGCLARNSHILPAPITLLPRTLLDTTNDNTMLQLPFVEHLTLSNCWITPTAIINLVKNHENVSMRKITFDSVSLTAHPKTPAPNGGNQQAAPINLAAMNALLAPPFGLNGPLQGQVPAPLAAQQFANQFWQGPGAGIPHGTWAHGMLNQMQQMMVLNGIHHHQLHHMWSNHPAGMTLGQIAHTLTMLAAGGFGGPGMFAGNGQANANQANPGANNGFMGMLNANLPPMGLPFAIHNPALPAPAPPVPPANQQWYEGHREGSWVDVIDALSPGPTLDMYQIRDEFDPPIERRKTALASIEFKSCGYARVHHAPFDQGILDSPIPRIPHPYFIQRRAALSCSLLSTSDRYLASIIQYMPEREQDALTFAWDMRMGWNDERKAQEAEFDGCLPGGTGRFSGTITQDSPLGDAARPST